MKKMYLLALIFVVSSFWGCTTETGVINEHESNSSTGISMSYEKFSGCKQRLIEVKDNAPFVITVDIVSESGSIDVYITRENGQEGHSYEGHSIQTSIFTVTLTEPGNYTIQVEAKKHIGGYSFSWGD